MTSKRLARILLVLGFLLAIPGLLSAAPGLGIMLIALWMDEPNGPEKPAQPFFWW